MNIMVNPYILILKVQKLKQRFIEIYFIFYILFAGGRLKVS